VSLRKCPDCGQDVSSAALACPHCGRPNRRTSSPIELSGILIIAVVCAAALLWRLSSQYQAPSEAARVSPPETMVAQPAARPGARLTATVGYNRTLFNLRVENGDPFAWTGCQLSLNAQGVSSGYTREVETIRPGLTEAALLASGDFADADGRRFDPAAQQVATLDIACETPQGRRSYAGKFQPDR
jgi:hypothetical protein